MTRCVHNSDGYYELPTRPRRENRAYITSIAGTSGQMQECLQRCEVNVLHCFIPADENAKCPVERPRRESGKARRSGADLFGASSDRHLTPGLLLVSSCSTTACCTSQYSPSLLSGGCCSELIQLLSCRQCTFLKQRSRTAERRIPSSSPPGCSPQPTAAVWRGLAAPAGASQGKAPPLRNPCGRDCEGSVRASVRSILRGRRCPS